MKWFALLGLVLFLGVAVAPSITADVEEQNVEPIPIDTAYELEQQEQRLQEFVDGILSYVERIYGQLTNDDCECEEIQPLWKFPFICTVLYAFFGFFMTLSIMGIRTGIELQIDDIGDKLDCYWSNMIP